MQVKTNHRTGEQSLKLMVDEKRCLKMAFSLLNMISNNLPRETAVQDEAASTFHAALQHVIRGTRDYTDKPAEQVMDPDQTGVLTEPAKKGK